MISLASTSQQQSNRINGYCIQQGAQSSMAWGAGKHFYSLLTERDRAKYPSTLICFSQSEGNEQKSTLHFCFNQKNVLKVRQGSRVWDPSRREWEGGYQVIRQVKEELEASYHSYHLRKAQWKQQLKVFTSLSSGGIDFVQVVFKNYW